MDHKTPTASVTFASLCRDLAIFMAVLLMVVLLVACEAAIPPPKTDEVAVKVLHVRESVWNGDFTVVRDVHGHVSQWYGVWGGRGDEMTGWCNPDTGDVFRRKPQ